jgi:hypothetical protein
MITLTLTFKEQDGKVGVLQEFQRDNETEGEKEIALDYQDALNIYAQMFSQESYFGEEAGEKAAGFGLSPEGGVEA